MQVSFLTSWQEQCGIAEYSRHLLTELRQIADVQLVPTSFRRCPRTTYRALGTAMNQGEVAHAQHSYAIFGGMHPLRSGWTAAAGEIRKPLVVTVHELDLRAVGSYHLPAPLERAYKRYFNRKTFLHPAIRWWMVHAAELRASLINLGVPQERITYRPFPLETPTTLTPNLAAIVNPSLEPTRRALRLEGKRPLVILGFLARRKGYDLALKALASLPSEFVLVAAGGTHAADRTSGREQGDNWLRSLADEAGLGDRLRITGFLPETELDAITALAEVVLAPFREMSASASLAYALARGKPIIASDLPENRALPCVELFPTGDWEALAGAIRRLSDSEARKSELSAAALRYAREHSYHALAEETIGVYNQLLEERRRFS